MKNIYNSIAFLFFCLQANAQLEGVFDYPSRFLDYVKNGSGRRVNIERYWTGGIGLRLAAGDNPLSIIYRDKYIFQYIGNSQNDTLFISNNGSKTIFWKSNYSEWKGRIKDRMFTCLNCEKDASLSHDNYGGSYYPVYLFLRDTIDEILWPSKTLKVHKRYFYSPFCDNGVSGVNKDGTPDCYVRQDQEVKRSRDSVFFKLEQIETYYDSLKRVVRLRAFEFPTSFDGNCERKDYDTVLFDAAYTYNLKNQIEWVEVKPVYTENYLKHKYRLLYDKQNRLKFMIEYTGNGRDTLFIDKLAYNSKGKVLKRIRYYPLENDSLVLEENIWQNDTVPFHLKRIYITGVDRGFQYSSFRLAEKFVDCYTQFLYTDFYYYTLFTPYIMKNTQKECYRVVREHYCLYLLSDYTNYSGLPTDIRVVKENFKDDNTDLHRVVGLDKRVVYQLLKVRYE